MQEAIHPPPAVSLPRIHAGARSHAPANALTFADVLQRTLTIFVKHPVALLLCAVLCFATGALVGTLIYAVWNLLVFVRNENYFATAPTIVSAQLLVQAMIGTLLFLIGRGAVTWITIQSATNQPLSLRAAFHAALRKWRPLLISSLLYGALITLGVAGFAWLLREVHMDVSNFRWMRNDPNSVLNMVLVRSLSSLPPDPGAPLGEAYAQVRFMLSRQSGISYVSNGPQTLWRGLSIQLVLVGVASMLILVLTETALCLRTAVIMRAPDLVATGWLRMTLALVARNFWRVMIWRWAARMMLVALLTVFFVLPTALQQGLALSLMIREVRAYWPYALNTALYGVAAAIVGAIVFAFNTAFDAQLCLVLSDADSSDAD